MRWPLDLWKNIQLFHNDDVDGDDNLPWFINTLKGKGRDIRKTFI